MNPKLDTPMLRQYWDVKVHHQDAILFFRLGDFYEMFLEDAKLASRELDLVLTGRGKDENRVPMCGIPHHSSDQYIIRLVNKGYKVAICEQVEEASASKGLTKREVVKIVTPGTVIQENGLDKHTHNYLMAIDCDPSSERYSCAFMEVSTGEFRLFTTQKESDVLGAIDTCQPKEVVLSESTKLDLQESVLVSRQSFPSLSSAEDTLTSFFNGAILSGFGIDSYSSAYPAAAALVNYVTYTQKGKLSHISRLVPYRFESHMSVDATTLANLEVVQPLQTLSKGSSLFDVLNHTQSAMGARLLKHYLRMPLLDEAVINRRLDAVGDLVADILSREEIRDVLSDSYDLERLLGRIGAGLQNPRDCFALLRTFSASRELPAILEHFKEGQLAEFYDHISGLLSGDLHTIMHDITACLVDDPPPNLKDGHVIRAGYDSRLDELNDSFKTVREWIDQLEERLKAETEIKSLKVRYNKVFGYYIEVPKLQQDKVPDYFVRKQTLTNAERFITPELKDKETVLLHGEDRRIALEQTIYNELVSRIMGYVSAIQRLADVLSQLDVLQSLATVAQRNGYTRPLFNDELGVLHVKKGRHPVLEHSQKGAFIANDIHMTADDYFFLITGPNMAGKSTMMRQVALWIIMAQIGSFVPADSMVLSLVDQLFSRIGAMDNLYHGQSTFMVEMLETGKILNNATDRSFVILDEVGRGTSTFDGVSLAYAISEYLHDHIKCRTLFATHYHELTQLAKRYSGIDNYNMSVNELEGKIVFSYSFLRGCADKSYGVHVAQMAGLPVHVTDRANELLSSFEQVEGSGSASVIGQQLSLF